ncbi:hypothetical protein KFE94_18045 [bacterium SCSIO 12643]|nr:hypothetical protein KFE94_18045 [bacterium SCSIO 12643]
MKKFLGILLLFISVSGFGQSFGSTADSIEEARIMNEFYYKTKFQVRLAHERTLLTKGVDVKINALRVGVQFKQRYKFGLQGFISRIYRTEPIEVPEVSYYNTAIVGYGAYFEYVFIENYRYYLGVPVTLSNAWVTGNARDHSDERIEQYDWISNRFGVFSLGTSGGYSVNYWLSVFAGLGYRFSFSKDQSQNDLLTTPFYSFGIRVQLGHFIKTVFKHQEVNKMKAIYFRDKNTWRAKKFKSKHPNL